MFTSYETNFSYTTDFSKYESMKEGQYRLEWKLYDYESYISILLHISIIEPD